MLQSQPQVHQSRHDFYIYTATVSQWIRKEICIRIIESVFTRGMRTVEANKGTTFFKGLCQYSFTFIIDNTYTVLYSIAQYFVK